MKRLIQLIPGLLLISAPLQANWFQNNEQQAEDEQQVVDAEEDVLEAQLKVGGGALSRGRRAAQRRHRRGDPGGARR